MRFAFALAVLAAATLMSAPRAEAAGWCYDGEQGTTCGFVSLQQCLDALSATATGTCLIDPQSADQESASSRSRKRAAH